jgi:hypothetical protein
MLPLAVPADIRSERLDWSGHYLVNPFAPSDEGSLVRLTDYPGLKQYLESKAEQLKGRHVAKGRSEGWFRTIDRIWPSLVNRPKLLIPDIQVGSIVGYDEGTVYPHHNLYWITSEGWDLRALQALLRSESVRRQVAAYSVQMRGGSIRYQAQVLRRVRLPGVAMLSKRTLAKLASLGAASDQRAINKAVAAAFEEALDAARVAALNGTSGPRDRRTNVG